MSFALTLAIILNVLLVVSLIAELVEKTEPVDECPHEKDEDETH